MKKCVPNYYVIKGFSFIPTTETIKLDRFGNIWKLSGLFGIVWIFGKFKVFEDCLRLFWNLGVIRLICFLVFLRLSKDGVTYGSV